MTFTVYPAIAPKGDGIEIAELGTLSEAEAVSRQGLLRLALLALPQQATVARQHYLGQRELVLLSQSLKTARPLAMQDLAHQARRDGGTEMAAHHVRPGDAASGLTVAMFEPARAARCTRDNRLPSHTLLHAARGC